MSGSGFTLDVVQREGFQFDIDFGDPTWDVLHTDEPAPLGEGKGPNPARVLAAAVGNCLAASLLFCLQKSRVEISGLRARVEGSIERNDAGRLRIAGMKVVLEPELGDAPPARLERCLEIFEDFCVVTQSVREGFDVEVEVSTPGGE
ncbi:MAG: OsmC family protein [Gemmatimonadota bacterium]|nr:OsmC family protein [Gemmatimonadota bacterium]MDH5760067.1 OsmC family protein [Gemmatimonadota bacterium]